MQSLYRILKWSEKYTKTDMTYLAKGGFWLLSSQVAIFFFSLALLWGFANLTTRELYGEYRFLVTAVGILSITTLPGMRTALTRAVARGNSGILPALIRTRIKWGGWGSFFAVCVSSYYYWNNNFQLGTLFIFIAIATPFLESFHIFNAYEIGRKDYRSFTSLAISRHAFIVLCTLGSVLLSENIYVIFGTYLISNITANYMSYRFSIWRHPVSEKSDTETLSYGKKLSLMSAISVSAGELDKVVLWYLAGPVQVAVYTIAIALPREVSGALSQVIQIALPKMATQKKEVMQKSLLRKTFIFFLASTPLFIAYILAAPMIFQSFLPQYSDSVIYSQVAALLIPLTPFALLSQYFQATMHTKALYAQQFIVPIISIALLFALIPLYGVLGAVIAFVGKFLASFAIMLYYFLKEKLRV